MGKTPNRDPKTTPDSNFQPAAIDYQILKAHQVRLLVLSNRDITTVSPRQTEYQQHNIHLAVLSQLLHQKLLTHLMPRSVRGIGLFMLGINPTTT
jgi:hypothetical protein